MSSTHSIKAPRGAKLSTNCWDSEAAMRLLMNNLDPEVAEDAEQLIVYGGIGKAARNWPCYEKIIAALQVMRSNQTLLVQSGKPVGLLTTHEDAPRVLIANSNLVPCYANWQHFNELDKRGLMMYGQMTAGSWIYIGSQGIVQGTYQTFISVAAEHFNHSLAGKWILTAGLGGMGGAQPLAATLAGACMLAVECDSHHLQRRKDSGYLDAISVDLDDALAQIDKARQNGEAISVGLLGNAAEIYPELLQRGVFPDVVTDQTSAHDPKNGYLPAGWSLEKAEQLRSSDPDAVVTAAKQSMAQQVEAMVGFQQGGSVVFDYGNNIRQMALDAGCEQAFAFSGFVPAYIRPLFCRGIGPFRWVALSGDKEDIFRTDAAIKALFPDNVGLQTWLDKAATKVPFQGLPARICWLGLGERALAGEMFNEMVARGELKAPIAIGRDHLDAGSVASPNRETEAMLDGSDAVSDWPLLNALVNCASGASWVSIHHGGGVGMGYSQHAGMVIVADGSARAAKRLRRVLTNDPAMGVIRHADAGYADALDCAAQFELAFYGH